MLDRSATITHCFIFILLPAVAVLVANIDSASCLEPRDDNHEANKTNNQELHDIRPPKGATNESMPRINQTGGNSTSNVTSDLEEAIIKGIIVVNTLIFLIGLCGNMTVIAVILKSKKIGGVTDIYILNLAFADLCFILGLIFLITTMFIDHWIFGNLMCKLYMSTTSLNQFASSLLLVVMSFDRFLAVCHPIYAQQFRRLTKAKVICLCIWMACLILMSPILSFAKLNNLTCGIFWPEEISHNADKVFTIYSFAIGFASPLLLIAASYICVIRKLRSAASGVSSFGSRRSRSRETTNRRIEHLVIGIICTYTVCWLPYWIVQLSVSFSSVEESPADNHYSFILIATSLSYTNSALNPILYAFLSDNFKRRCSEILRSMYSFKCCTLTRRSGLQSTAATTGLEQSGGCQRQESMVDRHHTVILNEPSGLVNYTRSNYHAQFPTNNTNTNINPVTMRDNAERCNDHEDNICASSSDISCDNRANSSLISREAMSCHGIDLSQFDHASDCSSLHHCDSNSSKTDSKGTSSGLDASDVDQDANEEDQSNRLSRGHSNCSRKRSVAFSVDTFVVQGINNGNEIIKRDDHLGDDIIL